MKLEKGLSENTVEAYMADLQKLLDFLSAGNIRVREVKEDDLHSFLAGLADIGIHPRSMARILSGIRSFYRFLCIEKEIKQDPTELLEAPKIGRRLPEILTVEEIDRMIGIIDLSQPEGHRNRAMLELLYSCGLRVSELCALRLSDLFLEEGFIRVTGKGSKERLVPISRRAVDELHDWFYDRNAIRVKPGAEDFVFLSVRRGTSLSRITVFYWVKEIAAEAGIVKSILGLGLSPFSMHLALSLVVVLNADAQLVSPSVRAEEHLFATLLQVAGRAGRDKLAGRVMIQTRFPTHPIYADVRAQDYEHFAARLLSDRREAYAPPYSFQALLTAQSDALERTLGFLRLAKKCAEELDSPDIAVYDPVPMVVMRLKDAERGQLLIESLKRPARQAFLHQFAEALKAIKEFPDVSWSIEVDPQDV